jgi:long-chain acyl-CoA synthetase
MDLVAKSLQDIRPTIAVCVPRVYEKLYARILSATGLKRVIVVWARRVALGWTDAVFAGGPGPWLSFQHMIADHLVYAKIRKGFGNRIRFFVSGAAPLSPVVAKFFYGTRTLILEGRPVRDVARPTPTR